MATIILSPATGTGVTPNYDVKTYKALFENICRVAGIEPSRMLADDSLALRDYINSAMREGWEYYQWPDLMESGSTLVSNISNYADYDLFSINKLDPKTSTFPKPYRYRIDSSGIQILSNLAATDTVYPRWRVKWYPFSGTEYSASSTYALGDMAYDSNTGDYYRSLADGNIGQALTDTAYWDRREIPAFLYEFIKFSALSELREAEGQGTKALMLKGYADQPGKAWKALILEMDKWERQKNQQLRPNTRVLSGG